MGSDAPARRIFRQKAIQAYQRGFEKDILPRLIYWPMVLCMWVLLGIFLVAGFYAWYAHVPVYSSGPGIVLQTNDGEGQILVFLSPDQAARVRPGLPALVQIGESDDYIRTWLEKMEPNILSPELIRKEYGLDGSAALLVKQPSLVGVVRLSSELPVNEYEGSLVGVKVETGTTSLLAAVVPDLEKFFGN